MRVFRSPSSMSCLFLKNSPRTHALSVASHTINLSGSRSIKLLGHYLVRSSENGGPEHLMMSLLPTSRIGDMIGRFPSTRHRSICGLFKGNWLRLLNLWLKSGG